MPNRILNPPLVSVVVLNYNGLRYMAKCITSILAGNYPYFELIIVDNASTDNSMDLLRNFHDERIQIIQSGSNIGFAAGNNLGYRYASGKYVVILNNDTVVDPNWLQSLVSLMESDPKIGVTQSKLFAMDGKLIDSTGDFMDHFGYPIARAQGLPDSGEYCEVEDIFSARGAALMIRRSALGDSLPFDDDFFLQYEDIDLCWRLRLSGYTTKYVPSSIVFHEGLGTHSAFRIFHARKNAMMLLIKNYNRTNLLRYGSLHILTRLLDLINDIRIGDSMDFVSALKAYFWLLKNARTIVSKRKLIQTSRIVTDDISTNLMLKTTFGEHLRFLMELARTGGYRAGSKADLLRIAGLQHSYLKSGFQSHPNQRMNSEQVMSAAVSEIIRSNIISQ
jgi:GT2 family glycosyltransferase